MLFLQFLESSALVISDSEGNPSAALFSITACRAVMRPTGMLKPNLRNLFLSGPSYGVYISQLIRYAQCCSHYDDFRYRHKCLVDRLLSQGYKALRLEKSFKKFYGRYQDLIEKYRRSVNAMVSDSFPGQFLFNM